MPSSSRKPKLAINRKTIITERLTADWGGIDHPLWRKEAADKINLAIETFLCIMAMNDDATPESNAAASALIFITGWNMDEFMENVNDVMEKVMLVNSQEGGMQ